MSDMDLTSVSAALGQLTPDKAAEWKQAQDWLEAYGYVAHNVQLTPDDMAQALRAAQSFWGIPATGEYDEATKQLFAEERCGNPDRRSPAAGPTGPPTFVIWGNSVRDHLDLRYGLQDLSRHKSQQECRDAIRDAFYYWSAVAPFTFTEDLSGGPVDILIRWGQTLNHLNCPSPFNPGTNAHCMPLGDGPSPQATTGDPSCRGQIHFADDKVQGWTVERMRNVAIHEIGHALGLDHSYVLRSWMKSSANPDLHLDDIAGLRHLYAPLQPLLCGTATDLFQLLPNGLLYQRTTSPTRNGWTLVDDNPLNDSLAACGPHLYLLHQRGNARIYLFTGTPRKWERIASFPDSRAIATTAASLYVRRQDTPQPIWRYSGTGQDWTPVDAPDLLALDIHAIAACSDSPSERLCVLAASGAVHLLRNTDTAHPTLELLWTPGSDAQRAVRLAFAGASLYFLLQNGTVMQLREVDAAPNDRVWVAVDDDARNDDIACASGVLLFRRSDGTLWRYAGLQWQSGGPLVEMLSDGVPRLSVAATGNGVLYVVLRGGEIWMPVT